MSKSTNKLLLLIVIAYLVLLAIFTFVDLPIEQAINNPGTGFAKVMETIGTVPMGIVGVFACVSFIMTMNFKHIITKILVGAIVCLDFVYFFYMAASSLKAINAAAFVPALIAHAIWAIASVVICRKLIADGKRDELRRVAYTLLITCAVGVIAKDLIKYSFGRVRYRLLEDPSQYDPWYVIQGPMDFVQRFDSSFPSGHATNSTMVFCVFVLPYITDLLKDEKSKKIALIVCSAFVLCVWIARMMDGAHYASDVLTGSAMVLITFLICKGIFLDPIETE